MRNRLRCWLTGHDRPHWTTFTHAGNPRTHQQTRCRRCGQQTDRT
jgi:hypothetical protein